MVVRDSVSLAANGHVVVPHDGDVSGYLETRAKHAVKDTDRG
jgi:hypothetical protein